MHSYQNIDDYIAGQAKLWFGHDLDIVSLSGRVTLGRELRGHNFLRTFLQHFEKRRVQDGIEEMVKTQVIHEEVLLSDLAARRPAWDAEQHRLVLNSFISLCAHARSAPHPEAYFLQLRSELWMRELSRMVPPGPPAHPTQPQATCAGLISTPNRLQGQPCVQRQL